VNWKLLDELFASFSRPYAIYANATSVAVALPLSIYLKAGDVVIGGLAIAASGIAGGTALLRTMDKKTAATAATADKRTAMAGAAPLKTDEVA